MTTTVRGLKYKIHQEFYDFIPGFEKQAAEYKKAVLPDYEVRHSNKNKRGNKGEVEEPSTYPYQSPDIVSENKYADWIDKVVNEKTKTFFPAKDEETNRAIPNTGAWRTVRTITRLRVADGSEYLVTKSDLHGWDALGQPVDLFISSRADKWVKPIFRFKTDIDPRTKQLERIFDGLGEVKEVYDIPYSKEAVTDMWNQRQDDLITLVVKDERQGGTAHQVMEATANNHKNYELLRDSDFDYLFNGNYLSPVLKEELRQRAVAEGWIRGGAGDYTSVDTGRQPSNTKNLYK